MKSRFESHITLIELAMALLFFLFSSVTILNLYTTAHAQRMYARQLDSAMVVAQRCAEAIAGCDAPQDALLEMGFRQEVGAHAWQMREADFEVRIELTQDETLLSGTIDVYDGESALIGLPIARYYNKEVISP